MIVCSKTGKDAYERKSNIKKNNAFSRKGTDSFKCAHCGLWHFGTPKPLDHRVKFRGSNFYRSERAF